MKTNNFFKAITLLVLVVSLLSCERLKNTTFRFLVINRSTKDLYIENRVNLPNKILYSDPRGSSMSVFKETYDDEVLPEYSKEDFESKIPSLKIYYIDYNYIDGDDTIFVGGDINYSRKIENWTYHYYEDDGYAGHEYRLTINDQLLDKSGKH